MALQPFCSHLTMEKKNLKYHITFITRRRNISQYFTDTILQAGKAF